jgi:hypothetical protein
MRTAAASGEIDGREPEYTSRPEKLSRFLEKLSGGNTIKNSCILAGFSASSFYSWEAQGKVLRKRADAGETMSPREQALLNFLDSVEQACAEAIERNVATIQVAGYRDWKASAWWLAHIEPDTYGDKTVIANAKGEALRISVSPADMIARAGEAAEHEGDEDEDA